MRYLFCDRAFGGGVLRDDRLQVVLVQPHQLRLRHYPSYTARRQVKSGKLVALHVSPFYRSQFLHMSTLSWTQISLLPRNVHIILVNFWRNMRVCRYWKKMTKSFCSNIKSSYERNRTFYAMKTRLLPADKKPHHFFVVVYLRHNCVTSFATLRVFLRFFRYTPSNFPSL